MVQSCAHSIQIHKPANMFFPPFTCCPSVATQSSPGTGLGIVAQGQGRPTQRRPNPLSSSFQLKSERTRLQVRQIKALESQIKWDMQREETRQTELERREEEPGGVSKWGPSNLWFSVCSPLIITSKRMPSGKVLGSSTLPTATWPWVKTNGTILG